MRQLAPQHDLAIRVAVYFDGTLINVYWLHRRGQLHAHGSLRTLWIGEGSDVNVPCQAPELPAARFPLVRGRRGGPGYSLLCPESLLDGSLLVDRQPATLHTLLPDATPCEDHPGVLEISLRSGVELTLNLGLLSLRVSACQLPRRLSLSPGWRLSQHVPTVFMTLLASAVAVLASSVPPSPQPLLGVSDFAPHVSISLMPPGQRGAVSKPIARSAAKAARASSSSKLALIRRAGRVDRVAEEAGPSFAELIAKQSILGESATAMAELDGKDSISASGSVFVFTGHGGSSEGSIALEDGMSSHREKRKCGQGMFKGRVAGYPAAASK